MLLYYCWLELELINTADYSEPFDQGKNTDRSFFSLFFDMKLVPDVSECWWVFHAASTGSSRISALSTGSYRQNYSYSS